MEIEVVSQMPFKPFEDRVVIAPFEKEAKMGRVILPEISQKPANRGLVVAVGPGRCVGINSDGELVYTPMGVKVGDIVAFGYSAQPGLKPGSIVYTLAGQPISEGGVDYIVLRIGELICRVMRPEEMQTQK